LTWGYKPKPDSAHRFNLTVDADIAPIPIESWVVSLIAAERRRPDVIAAVLEHYRSKQFLIGHLVAECSHVMVVGVLWTMSVQTWNAIRTQIAERPEPGPLRRALLLERQAFVAAHGQCGGFESGFTNGRTWMACTTCGVRIEREAIPDDA
jgi:hypothetical protein